jgi:hypothetical protein
MSKLAIIDTLTPAQAERVDRIKSNHAALGKTFDTQVDLATFVGLDLLKAKEEVGHGKFMEWREAHLPEIAHRTCTGYMGFASKLALAANLNLKQLQAPDHEVTDKEKKALQKAVHDHGDGKCWTQLYRDLGLIRDKKEAGGAKRAVTAEEKTDSERAKAKAIGEATLEQIATCKGFGDKEGKLISEMPLPLRREILAASVQLNKVLRKFCKGGKKGARKS